MKKLTLFVIIIFLLIGTFGQEVFAQKTKSGLWNYFTQDKNITNLSTQLPAQKGLLKKVEDDGIKSIGNYQEKTSAPRTHFEFNISIHKEKNRITLKYGHKPEGSQINHRIPIFQQIFREDVPNTHIYFILPKKMILTKEMQTIITINNMTEKLGFLSACSPEDTKLSQLLKKYNATIEGTYNLTSSEKTELERAFDNTTDIVGGKVGKVAEGIKRVVKWGIDRDESKRLQSLIKKYGTEYKIYKIPFYIPEGISLAYTHIGRQAVLAFNLSELTESTKVFIEIPQLTFELDASGATRKASIEGLTYEVMIEPVRDVDEPVKSMEMFAKQIFEAVKTKDRKKITQLVMLSKEDCMDGFYLYPTKSKGEGFFDFFSHMLSTERNKMIDSIPLGKRNQMEKEISTKIFSYNEKRKTNIHKKMEEFYTEAKKHKINWTSIKYLRCFSIPENNLYIVFLADNKEYFFSTESILLFNGWKISSRLTNVSFDACQLMKQESNANIVPGKTKKELDAIRLQHTKYRFDKIKKSALRYYTESGKVPNEQNIYSIFGHVDSPEFGYCRNGSSSTAGFFDGWGKRIVIMPHLTGGIVLKSSGPDRKMDSDDDLFGAVAIGEQKEPDKNIYRRFPLHKDFREVSQEEANSINKKFLKKIFLGGGSLSLSRAIIHTKKFSNNELFRMADQSKCPFDAFNALYLCDVISWERFMQIMNYLKKKK